MECWEQSTHLSWLTTNTTQSHTKKQHLFLTNKNKREHTKSFNFHQHSVASPAQQSLHMSIVAPCTQLLQKLITSCTQSCTQFLHKLVNSRTQSCTHPLMCKLITSCTLFRFISVPSCCTRWLLNRFGTYTHNTQELTYKHRRWKKHTHISVNTPYKSFTFPYYSTEVFIDTQCSFHSWCLLTASSGMDTC